MRSDAEIEFNKIFNTAVNLGASLSFPVQIVLPRLVRVQKHRDNHPTSTPEHYYRVSLFIPLLESIIEDLSNRFPPETLISFNLNKLLPSVIKHNQLQNDDVAIESLQNSFGGFLGCHARTLHGEYKVWKIHWENCDSNVPELMSDVLKSCNESMYPAFSILLKILSSLPVSVATAERSFSSLRRLKTWLRNTMGEDRLTGLALLHIHLDIDVDIDRIIDRFGNDSSRKLDFII